MHEAMDPVTCPHESAASAAGDATTRRIVNVASIVRRAIWGNEVRTNNWFGVVRRMALLVICSLCFLRRRGVGMRDLYRVLEPWRWLGVGNFG